MFDCGFKSQYIGGQKEKFVRLDDLDSTLSMPANSGGMKRVGFNLDGLPFPGRRKKNASKSFRLGVQRGSNGLRTFGQSLRSGVTRAVFPEDLKVSEKKIFDPQDKSLLMWNKFFEVLCILSVSFDPLFFYLPVINHKSNCLGIDNNLAKAAVTLRTIFDTFYLIRIGFQFRTAYIAPSSRVFGRGELVIDPAQIAKRYLMRYFIVDFLSVLPIPQIVVWKYFNKVKKSGVLETKTELLRIVILQYLPRFARFIPLNSDVKKTAGVFSQNAVVGAIYYLVWFLLASHITGSAWYLLAVERNDACWQATCKATVKCDVDFLYCDNKRKQNYDNWRKISTVVLRNSCNVDDKNSKFNYGIYTQALSSGIVVSREVFSKFCYCLWWGLQNLSTLGSGLQTSTYPGEVLFSIVIAIAGLVLFALLIGNMQTYLQSITVRLEEMRIKRRDSEQWMHHRLLPPELREKVRRYDQYKWLETRGVDEESLVRNLPKDLRRDIKRHLCLNLVRRVPLFANMDERLLDAICERLKPSLCTESTYLVREGDPVNEMLFIIRGRLESVTTDGGRSGFFNRGFLQEGDFCGEELLTWALDPKSGSNWPSSTRTVRAITEVEAFALEAEELKFVASQFRRLHSRQVQHTFRFYSQQWRTWASCFIQAAWRRYAKRKNAEKRRMEEIEEEELDYDDDARSLVMHNDGSSRLGATILASRFAANALRGHRLRSTSSVGLVKLQKPPEPDFASDDAD
ncbi:putative Cyclic nucleotide-gated ion channel [Quillaja saponaria]|uniref:Cyclic nucleotide-gated ion channel n=1 Tax=Quillaja saponaria TaxID=32244 RepID=A0AAD7PEM5_QUISA|nr:putative Cyclic nucleotide-gated ion channel [Quillaja saponaria]